MQELTRRMASGAVWMVLAKVVDRGIGLVSTIILARLLLPADFGLASLAMAIMAGLQLLGAFSFDMALIQNPNASRQHYDTVWTIGVLFGLFLTGALLVLAYPAARFFNEPRLPVVMAVLALMALIGGLSNVGTVAFRKDMQFDREFRYLLARRVAVFVVTVTLAYLWRDYWALVAGAVTGTAIGVLISYAMHPYRPRFSLAAWAELFSFSRWMFINNTLGFLYTKAADMIVGKGLGTTQLGYYGIAYEIANLPSSELVMPINRAVFPGYAKMAGDTRVMRQGFLNVISMMALLAIPAAVGMSCVAGAMVSIVLGSNWDAVATLIPVLAINGVLTAILSCSGYVFLAIGKPRWVTVVTSAHIAIAVPLVIWAAWYRDLDSVAWALLVASLIVFPINFLLISRTLKITILEFLELLWRPVCASATMALLVVWLKGLHLAGPDLISRLAELLLLCTLGAIAYGVTVFALWKFAASPEGAESFVQGRLMKFLSGRVR